MNIILKFEDNKGFTKTVKVDAPNVRWARSYSPHLYEFPTRSTEPVINVGQRIEWAVSPIPTGRVIFEIYDYDPRTFKALYRQRD